MFDLANIPKDFDKGVFDHFPKDPEITVLDPYGNELLTTYSDVKFLYIRLWIKRNKLKGYKVKVSDGSAISILSNGKLEYWSEGYQIPGDVAGKLLFELL